MVCVEIAELREVPPEKLPVAIRRPNSLPLEVVVEPGDLTQLDDHGLVDLDVTEQVPVCPERVRKDSGVQPIVLRAGDREAIAEAIELLRVDREELEPALQERCRRSLSSRASVDEKSESTTWQPGSSDQALDWRSLAQTPHRGRTRRPAEAQVLST